MHEEEGTAAAATSFDNNDTKSNDKVCSLCTIPSSLRCGSDFNISGEFKDPMYVIKSSNDFENVVMIVKNIKFEESDGEKSADVNEMQTTEENARMTIQQECCSMLKEIGPPWNWLHNFTSHNCRQKSYNFLEHVAMTAGDDEVAEEEGSSDESFDYLDVNEIITSSRHAPTSATSTIFDDVQSSTSGVSIVGCDDDESWKNEGAGASNEHKGEII